MNQLTQTTWKTYCTKELNDLLPLLKKHGYKLDDEQPHLLGERFLMQAATTAGGIKLILFGTNKAGDRVVIKASRHQTGVTELQHERRCRNVLHKLKFAAEIFHTPEEADWLQENGFTISVQCFVDQTSTFLERPLEEQFSYALSAFKAQEGAHATTYSHQKLIAGVYEERTSQTYVDRFQVFLSETKTNLPETPELHQLLTEVAHTLHENTDTIEQYTGFLTHTDFVPHNIRIDAHGTMYLLDHSSLTFGNKHEGWARFINFMTLYNPPLAETLEQYVHNNRAPEEVQSLKLMRLYRLGELIWYYQNKLPLSEGNLYTLNLTRVFFWADILKLVLDDRAIPAQMIQEYKTKRDSLRSSEEKKRQQGLH